MSRHRLAIATAALAMAAAAQASTVYRWTDAQGRVHYADRVDGTPRAGAVERLALPAEAAAVARLRVEPDADGALAWVDNLLAGPIEVMLHAEGEAAVASDPPLPARGTVQPRSATLLARIARGNPRLRVVAVPGSPNARPRDVEYAWPLASAPLRIQQALGRTRSLELSCSQYRPPRRAPVCVKKYLRLASVLLCAITYERTHAKP